MSTRVLTAALVALSMICLGAPFTGPSVVVAAQSDASEDAAWDMVRDTADPAMLKKFLERFPKGRHAGEAQDKLDALDDEGALMDLPLPPGAAENAPRDLASMNDCDRFAADPYDIANPRTYAGVPDNLVDPKLAVPACRAAVATSKDPRYKYLLARALFIYNRVYYWYGLRKDYLEQDAEQVGGLLGDAVSANYAASYRLLAAIAFGPVVGIELSPRSGERYDRWSRLLLKGADLGDPFALRDYASAWPSEESGLDATVAKRLVEAVEPLADAGMPAAPAAMSDFYEQAPKYGLGSAADDKKVCSYRDAAAAAGDIKTLFYFVREWGMRCGDYTELAHASMEALVAEDNTSAMYLFSVGDYSERAEALGDYQYVHYEAKSSEDPKDGARLYVDLLAKGDEWARLEIVDPGRLGGQPLDRELIKQIQIRLKSLGAYSAPADGTVGPSTKAAVDRYFGTGATPRL